MVYSLYIALTSTLACVQVHILINIWVTHCLYTFMFNKRGFHNVANVDCNLQLRNLTYASIKRYTQSVYLENSWNHHVSMSMSFKENFIFKLRINFQHAHVVLKLKIHHSAYVLCWIVERIFTSLHIFNYLR